MLFKKVLKELLEALIEIVSSGSIIFVINPSLKH